MRQLFRLLPIAVLLLSGCVSLPPGKMGPSETVQMTPWVPSVGETVTIVGQGVWRGKVAVWMTSNDSFDQEPEGQPMAVKLGEATVDGAGGWTFTYLLKAEMGPTVSGRTLTIKPGETYALHMLAEDGSRYTYGVTPATPAPTP